MNKVDLYYNLQAGLHYKAVPRLGEFCSCSSLPLLLQLARNILSTWERPYSEVLFTGNVRFLVELKLHK